MEPQIEKAELIEWLSTVEDQNILNMVAEVRARYAKPFDFDEALRTGLTGDEVKKQVFAHIDTLPWKK